MKHTWNWLWQRIKTRFPAIMVLVASQVSVAVLGVVFALVTRNVIDSAVQQNADAFVRDCVIQGAIIAALILCNVLYRHQHDILMAELDRDWKKDILKGLLRSDYPTVSAFHSGELLNRMNNDVRILNTGFLETLPSVMALVTRLIAAVVVLTALEPWFALVMCLGGLVVIAVTGVVRKRLKKLHIQVSEQEGRVLGFLQEVLEKLLMVQAMDAAGEVENRAAGLMEERFQAQRKRKNVSLVANSCVNLMYQGASFAALIWCGAKLLHGQMSFGSLTAVIQLVNQLRAPFTSISAVIPKYVAMTAAAERLQELTELKREDDSIDRPAQELYGQMTAIRAEKLCFSYGRDVLMENLTLEIPRGAFVAITGPSGIGKSTLLKLLLGIYRPDSGRLYLELAGELLEIDRSLRAMFSYVPQGNLLLSGTLRENLLIGKPDAKEEEIKEALYVSAMDTYLDQLPQGLETVLGENGAGLSEGQAQRLAIARAILGGKPVLLLDECTSALDEQTERMVLERIRKLRDRTCIVVTHRSASVELCDLHLRMQQGSLLTT